MSARSDTAATSRLGGRVRAAMTNPDTAEYRLVQEVVIALIFLSVAAIVLETVHSFYAQWGAIFDALEWVFLLGFGLEYIANVYAAERKRAYVFSFWGLVDLLAIIPSLAMFIHVGGLGGLRVLRVLRVLRTLKLFKLAAVRAQESNEEAQHHRSTLWLDVQIYFIALFTVMIISATLVYYAESSVPDSPFTSIPAALWWSVGMVATHGSVFTTTTVAGKLVGAVSMLAGVALFGILTNVIGRALLTSLLGADPDDDEEEEEAQRRNAVREARRAQLASGAAAVRERVATTVQRVVQAAGPLPGGAAPMALAPSPAPGAPQLASAGESSSPATGGAESAVQASGQGTYGRPLTMKDSGYLLRSQVAAAHTRHARWPLKRLAYAAFGDHTSRLYRVVSVVIIACIFVAVAAIALESVDWIANTYGPALGVLEFVITAIFTVEYLAQIYIAEDRARYVCSFWGIIDFLAVAPSYIGLFNIMAVKIVRTLRVLRVLRILKLSKTAALDVQQSVNRSRNTFWLDLQIYLISLFTVIVLSATLVWYAEKDAGSGFISIPEGMWFAVVTLTTTGSGAPVPVTFPGRIIAGMTMLTGLALFGVLTSVIGRTMLTSLFGRTEDDDQLATS